MPGPNDGKITDTEQTLGGQPAQDFAPVAGQTAPPDGGTPPVPIVTPPKPEVGSQDDWNDVARQYAGAQRALVASSVMAAPETDAAKHARTVALAEKLQLPPAIVAASYDELKARTQFDQADVGHLLAHHPELAGWLADKDNAILAQHDLPILRSLDVAMRSLTDQDPTGILPPGFKFNPDGTIAGSFGGLGDKPRTFATIADLRAGVQEHAASDRALAQDSAGFLAEHFGSFANVVAGGMDAIGSTAIALKRVTGQDVASDRATQDYTALGSKTLAPGAWGDIQRGVGGLIADTPLLLSGGPLAGAADSLLAVRGAAGILAPIARSKFLTEAVKVAAFMQPTAIRSGINAGAEHGVGYGVLDYAINSAVPAAFGRTGLAHAIVPGMEAAAADGYLGAAKRLLLDGGFQATQNATIELANAIHERASGVDPDALNPAKLLPRLGVAGALGGLAGGAFNVPGALGGMRHREAVAASSALAFGDRLGAVIEQAALPEVGELAPQRMEQLLQKLTPSGAEVVYQQGEEWAAGWKKAGQDPQAVADAMGVGGEYRTALATGSEFAVPTGEFIRQTSAAHRAGKDVSELVLSTRQIPGAKSAAEGLVYHQGDRAEIDVLVADARAAAPAVAAEDPIYQHRLEQTIMGGGRSTEEAIQHAKLETALFRTLAARAGADPVAEYDRYKLTIAEEAPAGAPKVDLPDPARQSLNKLLELVRSKTAPKDPETAANVESMRAELKALKVDLTKATNEAAIDALAKAQATGTADAEALRAVENQQGGGELTYGQGERISPPSDSLAFGELLKQWRKAGGERETITDATTWRDLVRRSAMVDAGRGVRYEQPAYHGGDTFDRFSTEHIGNGTGHADYGWGLNFTSEKDVAAYYKRTTNENGRLYTVEIPDDSNLMQWTKPVAEQPPKVRAALELAIKTMAEDMGPHGDESQIDMHGSMDAPKDREQWTGQQVYNALSSYLNGKDRAATNKLRMVDRDKRASEWLDAHGVPGHTYPNESTNSTVGEERPNYLIYNDRHVEITKYEQPASKTESRGYISISKAREFAITLTGKANLSTLAHESAHFYFEVLGDFATRTTADPQLAKDYQTILEWTGYGTHENKLAMQAEEAALRKAIGDGEPTKAQAKRLKELSDPHEQFARGWEAYLMEGKAPSAELRGVFARFAIWMAHVYQSVKALAVDLSPEVRGAFDRMLASDDAIKAAHAEVDPTQRESVFRDGMTDAVWERYLANKAKATAQETDKVFQKAMAVIRRERTREYHAELERARELVTPGVDQRPVYIAEAMLARGQRPDGTELKAGTTPVKLDRAEILRTYGPEAVRKLPRGVTSDDATERLSLQTAADLFGFRTGEELWTALANMAPREQTIALEAESVVRERHPNLMTDGSMAEVAMAEVHNEVRGEILNAEALALAVKAGRKAIPIEQLRSVATRMVAEQVARRITPNAYLRAERRHGQEAFDLAAKDKFSEALDAKHRQMLNQELYRAAADARETMAKAKTFLTRISKESAQAMLGKAGTPDTWTVTLDDGTITAFDDGDSAAQFAAENNVAAVRDPSWQQAMNATVAQLRAGFKTMSYAQASALFELAQSIEHQARKATTLSRIAEGRDLEETIGAMTRVAEDNSTRLRRDRASPTWLDMALRGIENTDAYHTKLSFITRRIDGFKSGGTWWDLLVRPLNEAADAETERKTQSALALNEMFRVWDKGGIGKPSVYTPRYHAAIKDEISHMGRIMVALNWGAAANRERVLAAKWKGGKWSDETVKALLDTLDEADWNLVRGIWAHIAQFKPEIWAQEMRLRGIHPQEREILSIQTKFGEIPGGYFPIKYDANSSVRASDLLTTEPQRAGTIMSSNRGFTKSVVEHTGYRIRLDEGVISQHLGEVIHRLTHEDALADIRKLINNPGLKATIAERFGMPAYRVIRDTVGVAAQGEQRAQDTIERGVRYLRTGMSISTMGFNITSAAMQVTGVTQSIQRIGWRAFAQGMKRWGADAVSMENSARWVFAKSGKMRNRADTYHRDIKDALQGLGASKVLSPIRKYGYYLMQKMQMAVDLPTWMGAYDQAIKDFATERNFKGELIDVEAKAIAVADQAVVDAQGGGQTIDLAKVQRGSEWMKLFTVFYHYFNTTYNLGSESLRQRTFAARKQYAQGGFAAVDKKALAIDAGKLTVDVLMLISAPVALTAAIKTAARGSQQGDDPKEWAKRLGTDHLQYLLSTMIGGRELSGALDGFSYGGPAGLRGVGAVSDLLGAAFGQHEGKALGAAETAAGVFFHLPALQLQRIVDGYLWAQENKTNPVVPMLFGKPVSP